MRDHESKSGIRVLSEPYPDGHMTSTASIFAF